MQLPSVSLLLAALATTALAGKAIVTNECPADIYLTITRSNQQSVTSAIASGSSYSEDIVGQGNSFGITRNPDYFSPNTPKLIWGFSDVQPTLYYSINTVDGNPFTAEGFVLSSSDAGCGTVNTVDGRTRTCASSNNFTLTLC